MQTIVRTSKTISVLLAAALLVACAMPNIPPAAAVLKPPAGAVVATSAAVAAAAPPAASAPAAPAAQSEEDLLHALYERVAPSVVHITVVQRSNANGLNLLPPTDQPKLPGLIPPDDMPGGSVERAQGSGFIFDDKGYIITNVHVVEGAETIEVSFLDGLTVRAEIVALDPDSDIALIKVDSKGLSLQPLELAKIDEVFVGQRAIAIGNPFGQTWTLTTGIVSAIGRTISSGHLGFSIPEVIQTDAAINPGNSGGPLLNTAGQVIGVNTQIISESRSSAGIGFAVPASIVSQVAPSLLQGKSYVYPYLGIKATDLTLDMIEAMKLDAKQRGTQVIEVMAGGAAAMANIRQSERKITVQGEDIPVDGDVIVAINGSKVNRIADLIAYLVKNVSAGEDITLTVLRAGKQIEVKVTLQPRPTQ